MKKNLKSAIGGLSALILSVSTFAQNTITISGNVRSSVTNEDISAVSILVKGSKAGTFTDDKGNFKITGPFSLPATLVISSVGFANREVVVNSVGQNIQVSLDPVSALAQDVVVSTSRLPERILESPVTID